MPIRNLFLSVLTLLAASLTIATPATAAQPLLAPTPPMGWNSWDSYGLTISEVQYRSNARALASMKQFGWKYAVIDMGWYMADPAGKTRVDRKYQIDSNGLLVPTLNRFPTSANGAGFRPLSDWVHSLGLKFGFHIMRGIPKDSVEQKTRVAGTGFRATDAADTSDTCPWDDGFYGVRNNAAGQAYYDSMMRMYAKWGVDFLKVDCIADHPYKPDEIRMIAAAIKKAGRPIVLSLSPGPTHLDHVAEISRYAQMWRISNDIWDSWQFANHTPDGYPSGVETAFDNLARWNSYVKPGGWPDADMLPFGSLRPSPGMGDPRDTRLSHDEVRTQFTLWAISRSPLMLGANLTELDPFTRSIITNPRVIAVNQTSWNSGPITKLPRRLDNLRVWTASAGPRSRPVRYVAFFNLKDRPRTLTATWRELGMPGRHSSVNLWTGARTSASASVRVQLPAHGSAIYQIR